MRSLTFQRIIGAGAMGTVYHAELKVPRGFARQCAVKVMKATSPDQEHFRARMRDEARLLGMLQDEQILGVSELISIGSRDMVIMEYVEGVDLSDIVASRPVPPRALTELGAELAGTLHRAHRAVHPTTGEPLRIVHRDVKPANVMVTARGGVRLLDFGVARAAFSSRESQTQGLVLGTLNYFPPEILSGGDPTPAVDIYGLGLTLWECATGKEWGSPQVHRQRFERRVTQRLSEIGPEYAALKPVLEATMQWDHASRPDGREVERLLLAAADACTGEGLRTWARDVVPPMLERRRAMAPKKDDLVGRTFDIDAEVANGPPPLDEMKLASFEETPLESQTYNDLAPPSAVEKPRRLGPGPASAPDPAGEATVVMPAGTPTMIERAYVPGVTSPRPPPRQSMAAARPAAASGRSMNLVLGATVLVLLLVLLALLVVFIVVMALVLMRLG